MNVSVTHPCSVAAVQIFNVDDRFSTAAPPVSGLLVDTVDSTVSVRYPFLSKYDVVHPWEWTASDPNFSVGAERCGPEGIHRV